VLLEQIRTIDKTRLIKKMGRLSDKDMVRIDEAISISMGFDKSK
jgi:mRNA interferase MazF